MFLCKVFSYNGVYPNSFVDEFNSWSKSTPDFILEEVKFFANQIGELVSIVVLYDDGK